MEFKISLLFGVCAIICTQCDFLTVNALLGPDVREAADREFPFIVSLKKINRRNAQPNRDHICTAAMITKKHVLTAAQCTENRRINNTAVLYGSNTLIYGETYAIQNWILYNEWTVYRNVPLPYFVNDIAVILLTREIQGDFQPAALLPVTNNEVMGQFVELAGWGTCYRRVLSLNLLVTSTLVVPAAACESHIERASGRSHVIDERYFCTTGRPVTLLQRGDYGGPVLHFGRIIGVSKEILPEARSEYNHRKINVHISVHFYRDFIVDVTNENFNWF